MTKKILIIEDDPSILSTTLELLNMEGFDAIGAEDGRRGLQRAWEAMPDLILCDIRMPGLDGHGVLAELRKNPVTETIPFIFLTAQADRINMRQGMEGGADDYLTKPFAITELLAAIAARFEKKAAFVRQSEERLEDLRQALTLTLPHELRTPLMSILGYSELMVEDAQSLAPEDIATMASAINTASHRLYRLIENYLAYANIEFIRIDPQRTRALWAGASPDAKQILNEMSIRKAQQANRAADLMVDLVDIPPLRIAGQYLTKIIEELVDNAFKFSDPGTPVQIEAIVTDDSCSVRFVDHGHGISREQIARIGAYVQFDRKIYEQQGTGLGLIIAKALAELHEGRLEIESIPQTETIVTVTLPLA
jgi:signal transduction histidine kinase